MVFKQNEVLTGDGDVKDRILFTVQKFSDRT